MHEGRLEKASTSTVSYLCTLYKGVYSEDEYIPNIHFFISVQDLELLAFANAGLLEDGCTFRGATYRSRRKRTFNMPCYKQWQAKWQTVFKLKFQRCLIYTRFCMTPVYTWTLPFMAESYCEMRPHSYCCTIRLSLSGLHLVVVEGFEISMSWHCHACYISCRWKVTTICSTSYCII